VQFPLARITSLKLLELHTTGISNLEFKLLVLALSYLTVS